jgi:hypothetical protein
MMLHYRASGVSCQSAPELHRDGEEAGQPISALRPNGLGLGDKQKLTKEHERRCLALIVCCPNCRRLSVIKTGEEVKCQTCGYLPTLFWNGKCAVLQPQGSKNHE